MVPCILSRTASLNSRSVTISYCHGAVMRPLMPLIVMAVPLYDLSSVVWLRRRDGRGIFSADNSHFSHRLVAQGLTRRGAVMVVWLCTLATGLGGSMLHTLERWQAIVIACQTFSVLGILVALERREKRSEPER